MLWKIMAGGILIMTIGMGFLYNKNQSLIKENAALDVAYQEQIETINSLQANFQLQTEALTNMQKRNNEIMEDMNRYLNIFKRHNLTKLAAAKPGLIEPRINSATKDVFDGIEEDSRTISALANN
jgi:hypothetical protein